MFENYPEHFLETESKYTRLISLTVAHIHRDYTSGQTGGC